MNRAKTLALAGFCALAALAGSPSLALAQGGIPNCATLPNPVYMAGTTAVIPVIELLGARLKQVGVTLLWNANTEGCSSVNNFAFPSSGGTEIAVFSQYTEVANQPGKIIVSTCNGSPNQALDLVINDVAFTSCTYFGGKPLPSTVAEFRGPVQGVVPIVASSYLYYNDITAEELQDLYACGGNGNILTFTNSQDIFDYNGQNSGLRELFARGIGFPNANAFSTQIGLGANSQITAESMVTFYVGPTASPQFTIGYTSTEYYDQYRDLVRALKVRGVNQNLAYWPDSDNASTDKLNIREGRYTLQGTLRLVAAVDPSTGVPTDQAAKNVIDWFQGNPVQAPTPQLPFDVNEIYAQRGVVPQCAMKVTTAGDFPVFSHYSPPQPCNCSFLVLATGKTNIPCCVACTDSSTCQANQVCSHGYCE
ncbi:MAG: hypothetical protein WBP56_16905 [Polyangia bacterium]|jgi:ABC-type phosphate transport system substrate-binding protein